MSKKIVSLLLALLMLLSLSAAAADEIVVTDMFDRRITLSGPAQRILVMEPADCEILCALGCEERIVARGLYCDYPASVTALPALQSGSNTNVEELLALMPDVVIMSGMDHPKEQVDMLESCGVIPVDRMKKHPVLRVLSHVYTLAAVVCCFTIFRADSLAQGFHFLKTMFLGGGLSSAQTAVSMSLFWQQCTPLLLVTFAAAIVFSMPVKNAVQKYIRQSSTGIQITAEIASYAASIGLLLLCMLYLSAGTYSPFIYLNF